MNGSALKARRVALNLSQVELARALSVMPNTVARWEREERAIPPYLTLAIETIERRARIAARSQSRRDRDRATATVAPQ